MGAIPSAMSEMSTDKTSGNFGSETALVLFSGGQDSATCLAWALQRFARVETLGFAYGQRHAIELACRADLLAGMKSLRPEWAKKLGESHTLEIPTLAEISDTALTRDVAIAMGADGLPNTFVPGRNLVFLTFATALAYRRGITNIIGGMCETDYSGYPDCRDETIKALQAALSLGMDRKFELHTPLMWLDKAATWKLARSARRSRAGRSDPRTLAHLLSRRTRRAPRLGLWLRRMPGLCATRQGLARIRGGRSVRRCAINSHRSRGSILLQKTQYFILLRLRFR